MAGEYWTDAEIKAAILSLAEDGVMPSAYDLVRLGRPEVARRIGKRGGFDFWATECGLSRRPSKVADGLEAEEYVTEQLRRRGLTVDRQTKKCHFDLLVNRRHRVEVKSGSFFKAVGYIFGIGDKDADFVLLVPRDGKEFGPIYVVPGDECRQQTVTLTRSHRFQVYQDDFAPLHDESKPPIDTSPTVKRPHLTQAASKRLTTTILDVLSKADRPLSKREILALVIAQLGDRLDSTPLTMKQIHTDTLCETGQIVMIGTKKTVFYSLARR